MGCRRAAAAGAIRANYRTWRRGGRLVSCCLPSDAGQSAETCTEPHFFVPLPPGPPAPARRSLGRALSVNCETSFIESTTHEPRRGRPTLRSSLAQPPVNKGNQCKTNLCERQTRGSDVAVLRLMIESVIVKRWVLRAPGEAGAG
ncbi:hypothetical protein ACJJTC_012135 [Scirpophaga incertulas]